MTAHDQHSYVIAGCLVEQAMELLAGFAGVHAGHAINERVAVRQSKCADLLRGRATKKTWPVLALKKPFDPKS